MISFKSLYSLESFFLHQGLGLIGQLQTKKGFCDERKFGY